MKALFERLLVGVLAICALAMTALAVRREFEDARGGNLAASGNVAAGSIYRPTFVKNGAALATSGHTLGAPAAPIKLVEFSDFQCPYCAALSGTVAELLRRHAGEVAIVYRHYPSPAHQMAMPAAIASECAAEQGRFEQFADLAFGLQDSLATISLTDLAKRAGVNDLRSFEHCRQSREVRARVERDIAAGARIGVAATPTLVLENSMIAGATPLADIEAWIRSEGHSLGAR